MSFFVQLCKLDGSTGSSTRHVSGLDVENNSTFFILYRIFTGSLVPETNAGASREIVRPCFPSIAEFLLTF